MRFFKKFFSKVCSWKKNRWMHKEMLNPIIRFFSMELLHVPFLLLFVFSNKYLWVIKGGSFTSFTVAVDVLWQVYTSFIAEMRQFHVVICLRWWPFYISVFFLFVRGFVKFSFTLYCIMLLPSWGWMLFMLSIANENQEAR